MTIQEVEAHKNNQGYDIDMILEKYYFQRNHWTVPSPVPWAEDEGDEEDVEDARKADAWSNDHRTTGIKSDADFYQLQVERYDEVIMINEKPRPDAKAIAGQVYTWLKTQPDGIEIATSEAVNQALGLTWTQYDDIHHRNLNFYGGLILDDQDFFGIHHYLLGKINMGHKFEADFSAFDGQCVGLPYNIPFVFRRK